MPDSLPNFQITWRAILEKLTLDEKLVLNKFLKAHREALVKIQNQSDLLAAERAEVERLIRRQAKPKTDSDTNIPRVKTDLDVTDN